MTVAEILAPPRAPGRTLLVVAAHADDFALFCGGTLGRFADAGWRIVAVRATDDRWDSVDLDEAATIAANADELRRAAAILGIAEIVELDYPTDTLGDASELVLRERIIRLVREHRPYALATFDPYSMWGEDNQDHVRLAQAVDESFWTSQFDKHHPEHQALGLAPHGVFERWYFGRRVTEVTGVVDISSALARKVDAACAHVTPMRNLAHQLRLQARTGGYELPLVEQVLAGGDVRPLVEPLVRAGAARTGARHGLAAAEEFRVVRFGGLGEWLAEHGRPLPA
jgi:LmbE family N-acetylglucosaminyl deacetylase